MTQLEQVTRALSSLRAPIQQGEYDLHRLVMDALAASDLPAAHEVKLAPRCRVDVMCGGIAIEIKRGKPTPGVLLPQLRRYCECAQVAALVVVCERSVRVPQSLLGKPLRLVCLDHLWGIAL